MGLRSFFKELRSVLGGDPLPYPSADLGFRTEEDILRAQEMDLLMARQAAKEQGIGPDDPHYPKLSDVVRLSSGEDEAYGDFVMTPPRRFS